MLPPASNPTTLAEYRKRVLEDTYELAAALEIVRPLTAGPLHQRLERVNNWVVPLALRRLLSRSIVLAMLRLMDNSNPGPTGRSAGINALLIAAVAEGAVSQSQADSFRKRIQKLKDAFAANNYSFFEFIRFRNAHVGHSLIPHKPLTNNLMAHDLYNHAVSLLRIVTLIETRLQRSGINFGPPAMEKRQDWMRRSAEFWRRAAKSQPTLTTRRTRKARR